jgi:hypothetical protein
VHLTVKRRQRVAQQLAQREAQRLTGVGVSGERGREQPAAPGAQPEHEDAG